jgi:hypothetical protein
MTTIQQPEALVFANDRPSAIDDDLYQWAIDAEDLIRSQHARIADLEAQLFAIGAGGVEPLRKPVEDGWLQDGPLLYCLTDERRPRNRDEIIVTMANSSRTEEARTRRAGELLDVVRATAPQTNQADALDAARYRFLRETCWSSDKELATVISLQMNKVWDEKIDEAMARNKEE